MANNKRNIESKIYQKALTYFGPLSNLFLLILIIYFASYVLLLGVEMNKKIMQIFINK